MGEGAANHAGWLYLKSLGRVCVLFGGLLAAAGVGLSYFWATQAGKEPVSTVLLLQSDLDIRALLARSSFSALGFSDLSLIAAFVGMYGLLTLTLPLIFYVATREGLFKFLLLLWGMVTGLALTLIWFQWSVVGRIDIFSPSAPKIFYLYFAFLVAEGIKLAIEQNGLRSLPYIYFIDGLFGTAAVLIVQAGYELALESLLLGPFFLIAVAVAIFIAEWIMARPLSILSVGLWKVLRNKRLEHQLDRAAGTWARLRILARHFAREIRKARSTPYEKRVSWLEDQIGIAVRMLLPLLPSGSKNRRRGWWFVVGLCAFNLAFLALAAALAVWLF